MWIWSSWKHSKEMVDNSVNICSETRLLSTVNTEINTYYKNYICSYFKKNKHKQVYYIVSVTKEIVIVKLHQINESIQEYQYARQRASPFQSMHSIAKMTE